MSYHLSVMSLEPLQTCLLRLSPDYERLGSDASLFVVLAAKFGAFELLSIKNSGTGFCYLVAPMLRSLK
jgi:hypothetical protein